jgi:ribosomal protein S11
MLLVKILKERKKNVFLMKTVEKQIELLNNLAEKKEELENNFFESMGPNLIKYIRNDQNKDLSILFTISVKFSLTNLTITISDLKGKPFSFYSAGSIQVKGKQKKRIKLVFSPLLKHVMSNDTYVKNKPISLHLINTTHYSRYITKEISKVCLILFIKKVDTMPHNGCRPPKKRRKKYRTKKLK